MRGTRLRDLIAWVGLLASLVPAFAPGEGMVVCFEPSGEIALELAGPSRSCGDPAAPDAGNASSVTSPSPCCACVDVPVGRTREGARARAPLCVPRIDAPAALPPASTAASALALAPLCERSRLGAPTWPSGALVHLRVVVLRV
jgi:hypothetical protein